MQARALPIFVTWTLFFGASACCSGGRQVGPKDTEKADAACRAKPHYSPSLSAPMKADLDRRCAADPGACSRFHGAIAGVCSYQDKVAKIPLSDHIEVYTTLGSGDDLALDELCATMRSVAGVGFLQNVDVYIAHSGDPYWGKSWRRRCAQGSGRGGEHR